MAISVNLYETRTMLRMLNEAFPPRSFLLDTFFPTVETSIEENIDIDIMVGKRRMAPFVSPKAQGKMVERQGFTTRSFKPPYIKIKDAITAEDLTDRMAGQSMYSGNESPMAYASRKLAESLADFQDMINRREEWMAAQALNTGTIDLSGEGFEGTIDYLMPSANKITLAGTDLWTDAASDPVKNLRAWKRQVAQNSGLNANVAVLGTQVVDALLNNTVATTLLDNRRVITGQIDVSGYDAMGATYIGRLAGVDLFEYNEWYLDDAGVEQPMVPVDKIFMGSTVARTARHYGGIKDVEAGVARQRWWPKSWVEKDPSARILMLQSAPLVVMHQPGAFLSIDAV